MSETPEPIGTKKKSKIQNQNFSAIFFFFQKFYSKLDLETSTKALRCLKNPKFLIFDRKQLPENFWFRGC